MHAKQHNTTQCMEPTTSFCNKIMHLKSDACKKSDAYKKVLHAKKWCMEENNYLCKKSFMLKSQNHACKKIMHNIDRYPKMHAC